MEVSQLKVYSLGIVAANKPLNTHVIEVTPVEDLPMVDGAITDNADAASAGAKDTNGGAYQVELTTTITVKATWMPLGEPNRKTSPDVRRGETVMLWRFGDTDKFYWTTMKDDLRLRKLETVIWAFSATRDESKDTNPDSTYFLEISTHKKLLHFHTSRADNEPFGYDIQLNTAEGTLIITDDAGNSISLDSPNKRIVAINGDNSIIDISRTNIFLQSTDLINLKSKDIRMQATNWDVQATDTKLKSSKNTITSQTDHIGNFNLSGNLGTKAGGGGSGAVSISGVVKAEGTVEVGKLISHQAIDAPNVD
jgi:hypothetical protein